MKRAQTVSSYHALIMLLGAVMLFAACNAQYQQGNSTLSITSDGITPPEEWLPIVTPAKKIPGDLRDLPNCAQASFSSPPRGPWEAVASKYLAGEADPNHSSSDIIAYVGQPVEVTATARYDKEPLKNEWVRLFLHNCSEWKQVGLTRTDDMGQVTFPIPAGLPAGLYSLVFQVVGDASTIRTELWVITPETEIIALELDGAVIESVAFDQADEQTLLTERNPIRGALDLTTDFAQKGRLITYLTRGPERLDPDESLRGRLRKQGFPLGPLVEISSLKEPSQRAPIEVKTLYAADGRLPGELKSLGISIEEIILRADVCRPLGDGRRSGWTSHLAAQKKTGKTEDEDL